jgi:hypothetical protein
VRSVLRRTRLPLVVSLFLAALLGGPAAAPVGDALPVPATVTTVAAPAVSAPLAEKPRAVVPAPVAPPVVPAFAPEPVVSTTPSLADQVRVAATAPRAPPRAA